MGSRKEKVTNAINVLVKELNAMGSENEVTDIIAEVLSNEHRTLQQSFWRSIRTTAGKYSVISDKIGCDLRNQGAVGFCSNIAQDNSMMPYV